MQAHGRVLIGNENYTLRKRSATKSSETLVVRGASAAPRKF